MRMIVMVPLENPDRLMPIRITIRQRGVRRHRCGSVGSSRWPCVKDWAAALLAARTLSCLLFGFRSRVRPAVMHSLGIQSHP